MLCKRCAVTSTGDAHAPIYLQWSLEHVTIPIRYHMKYLIAYWDLKTNCFNTKNKKVKKYTKKFYKISSTLNQHLMTKSKFNYPDKASLGVII